MQRPLINHFWAVESNAKYATSCIHLSDALAEGGGWGDEGGGARRVRGANMTETQENKLAVEKRVTGTLFHSPAAALRSHTALPVFQDVIRVDYILSDLCCTYYI